MFLWLQRDFQQFCPIHHALYAGRGNSLPCNAVDLVEGVWFQYSLIGCTDEDLEPQCSRPLITQQLEKAQIGTIRNASLSSESEVTLVWLRKTGKQ